MQEAEEESSENAPAIPPLPEHLSVKANAEVEAEVRAKIAQAQDLLEAAVAAGNGGGAGGQRQGPGGGMKGLIYFRRQRRRVRYWAGRCLGESFWRRMWCGVGGCWKRLRVWVK